MNKIDSIYKFIDENLKESRKEHTRGVVETSKKLALIYGEDPERAEFAAMCHDMAKNLGVDKLNNYVNEHNLGEKYMDNENLAHGKVASYMLKFEFDVDDEDILNAVSYHTTGRAGMSLLEKIIYLADAIEPRRNYPGVEELRKLSEVNLDKACLFSLTRTIEHLRLKKVEIDSDTLNAKEYLEKR